MPKFHFQVQMDGLEMNCQEVSGLDVETQPIEYRHGGSRDFATIKMPGLKKCGNVTLKKLTVKADRRFRDWLDQVKTNTANRVPVVIRLLDEGGSPAMAWTLDNAWPTKVTGIDLKADGNEVAIENVELAHEGITVANG